MSSEQVIAACPFCGSDAECYPADRERSRWNVCCGNPGCVTRGDNDYLREDDAITAWNQRLSTPAADYECRAHACRRVRVEMEARNAEQAERNARQADLIRSLTRSSVATSDRLTALLDGIEGLEKEWRGHSVINLQSATDAEIARAVNFTLCRDALKALREKANGSHGVVPSPRPWPGKCIK